MSKKSGAAINYEALDVYNKVKIMILKWQQENRGQMPKYLFLSNDAFLLLNNINGFYTQSPKTFLGIEIAPVGVPGIYAAIGEEFN